VTLALDKDPTGSYLMMFEDDGAGFCTDQITKSNGLKNISVRAEKINAVLRIQSEQGRGTQVSLRFKIQKTAKHGVTV
jgi:signal transduction histidine kinase